MVLTVLGEAENFGGVGSCASSGSCGWAMARFQKAVVEVKMKPDLNQDDTQKG